MTTSYDAWVGREEERTEQILGSAVQALAATLDLDASPGEGDPLPPGWQWLFFNPAVRRSGLGVDGHPKRGGFLPPIELPRRMWAGSRIDYPAPLPVGSEATRRSRILKVENKVGKRGSLWFVTVQHTTLAGTQTCIIEEQDIVYREATPPGAAPAAPAQRHDGEAQWGRTVEPDTTLLFRYSALTFNGHRIHYDYRYVTGTEGYPDLVMNGGLTTLLAYELARANAATPIRYMSSRNVRALFVNRPIHFGGDPAADGKSAKLWAVDQDGALALTAEAQFQD